MLRNSAGVICFVALVLFWPAALLLRREVLFDAINAFGVSLGLAVIVSYLPGLTDAFRSGRKLEKGHYLVLGILATWIAMVGRTSWLWVWRWMGEPAFGLDHVLMAFVAWLIVIGGILHLLSPRVIDGTVPREGWASLKIAVLAGGILWAVIGYARYWGP